MAIKFSQFNLRTDHTSGMYLVGYDGNQNIHITVDNLFDDFINGTENTIAMFGTDGTVLADSILSQDVGATILTVSGQLNVDADATFDTSITVTGDSTLNGNVTLGNASADLITQTGTLYLNGPVKDTTDTLGVVDQVLLSDAAGELTFTDLADLHVGGAEVVELPVKNVQGSALVKGDPVYISGSVGASGRLEVQLADASNTLKMPAVGLLKQDLANNAQGFVVVTGKLRNLITDPIDGVNPTENDVIYIKPSGTSGAALTTTKPVYGNFIQNIGKVGRVSTSNDGNFVVSSILRTNDIPNLTPGRLWIGSTGNTIESQTIFVDEATGEVGIGTASPSYTADVAGTFRTAGQAIFAELGPVSVAELGGGSSTTSQFNIISTAGGGSFITATNRLVFKANNKDAIKINNAGQLQFGEYGSGAFTGTSAYNLSIDSSGNIIETAAVPANIVETITTTDGAYINLTPNSAASGAVTVTADLSATGAPDATKYLRGDNTWSLISGIYSWDISDGANNETIINGDTVTFSGDTYITTTYTAGNNTLSIDHDDTSRTDTASADSPGYGGTFTVVDSVSTNATGHLEAINVKTVTMPSADDTNTTYDLSGYGTLNNTAGIQLVGSDSSTDQVAITGAGTTSVAHSGNTITVTSNDQYTGTVTGSGAALITGGQISYWNSTTNIRGHSQLNYQTVAGEGTLGIGNDSLSFMGSRLVVGSGSGNSLMTLYAGSNSTNTIAFANGTSGNAQYRGQVRYNQQNDNLEFLTNGETFSRVYVDSASDLNLIERTLNFRNSFPYAVGAYVDLPTDNQLSIGTNGSERLRIGSDGQIGIGGANYGASGQVLTSSGSSSAPSWQTPTAGDITGVTAGNALTGGGTSGTVTINLSTEGPGAGTYGSSSSGTKINNITIDAYGRIQGITTGTTGSGSMSSWTIQEGNGTESTSVTNGETLIIAQGTGIQSEMTSTSSGGTITITNTAPDTGTPAILSNGSTPSLNSGITGPEVRSLIGAGTGSGDITGVAAGSYMTGGGASGNVTLNANASTSATGSTLAARDASGDITARLFRATYGNQSTISGAIAFRVNNSSDTYTRYCSNPTAIRAFIGAGTSSFSGSYNDLSNKPTIPTNNNQLTNGADYITSSGVAASYLRSDASDTFNAGNSGVLNVQGIFKVSNPSATSQTLNVSISSSGNVAYIANGSGGTIFFGAPALNTTNVDIQGTCKAEVFSARFNSNYYTDHADTGDSIRVAGDVVAYYSSDKRYKENIKPIESPIEKVKSIRGVTFQWNEKSHKETGKKDVGVIAQEVEEVLPEIVQTRDNGYKAVDYQKLTAVLIEAVKEQQKQIDELKSIINGSS